MAFLSKILFKPNKVLEILTFVSIYHVFKQNINHRSAVRAHVSDTSDVMICRPEDVLYCGTIMCLSYAQHWSHGWYPGGKRELDSFGTSEISEEIKLCEAGECSYLRPQRRSILRNILLDALARELQKRK
uniref:Progonadoliberin n=1 Tax=Stegastes partitus TaxID=144197 RepID=A0A3B5AW59_9TELE